MSYDPHFTKTVRDWTLESSSYAYYIARSAIDLAYKTANDNAQTEDTAAIVKTVPYYLATTLREFFTQTSDCAGVTAETHGHLIPTTDVYADLIQESLKRVDWSNIAESVIETNVPDLETGFINWLLMESEGLAD